MFLEAVKSLLRESGVSFPEDKELTVYDDFSKGYGGGCDTCGYGADEAEYRIGVSWDGGQAVVTYIGDYAFGNVIRDLAKQ